ncbi:MAG: polysaccharide deacetylase family protein [Oscillospiraceae bacterium]|jgi:polysaccharide deacetylase family sporulation protein PdaB|nr:polysaccharide deacetylase family protein [Oscillospiraceae bacterium]
MFKLKLPRPARNRFARIFITLSRKKLAAAGCALAAAAIFAAVSHPAVVGASASERMLPVYSVERDGKTVSLTFDAAWGNEDTDLLIGILGRYGVRATFFVVGAWAERYPQSVKALSDSGHEVMNHSDDHAHFTKLSPGEITANISEANRKIAEACGASPTLFRAPYGEYDDNVIKTVASMGMTTVQWDVDSLDWKGISAEEITKRVTGKVSPGSIVLFHNAAEHTPEALPGIIEFLIREGYAILPVSELLLDGTHTIDHAGRMRK